MNQMTQESERGPLTKIKNTNKIAKTSIGVHNFYNSSLFLKTTLQNRVHYRWMLSLGLDF